VRRLQKDSQVLGFLYFCIILLWLADLCSDRHI